MVRLSQDCVDSRRIVKRCGGPHASVTILDEFDPNHLINMDCKGIRVDGKRCDHLHIGRHIKTGKVRVSVIELKRGSPDASDIAQQLQGCAGFAEKLVGPSLDLDFEAVMVFGSRAHAIELAQLGRSSINFFQASFPIRHHRGSATIPGG